MQTVPTLTQRYNLSKNYRKS